MDYLLQLKDGFLSILTIISTCIIYLVMRKNQALSKQNDQINQQLQQNEKIIKIQETVIKNAREVKDVNISGNAKRMREGKL